MRKCARTQISENWETGVTAFEKDMISIPFADEHVVINVKIVEAGTKEAPGPSEIAI
jgi:hypothetical protein